jgi:ATP-dependent DNA ligase
MPSGDWIYEIKFDGYRALALRGGDQVDFYPGTKRT